MKRGEFFLQNGCIFFIVLPVLFLRDLEIDMKRSRINHIYGLIDHGEGDGFDSFDEFVFKVDIVVLGKSVSKIK